MVAKETKKTIFVVVGQNNLLKASGAVGAAFTREAAEQAMKDTKWICDEQKIMEVSIWEEEVK